MNRISYIVIIAIAATEISAQTLPEVHPLCEAPYEFNEWSPDSEAGTYPDNMIFHTISSIDPLLEDEVNGDWRLEYRLSSKSRLNGLGEDGISFNNTSTKNSGSGFLGAAVVGICTKNVEEAYIDWTASTIAQQPRRYAFALQYKIGADGEYINFGEQYIMSEEPERKSFKSVELPQAALDKNEVFLRWKYFYTGYADSGARAELGLDDIMIYTNKQTSITSSEFSSSSYSLSPNPASDYVNIRFEDLAPGIIEFWISDLAGNILEKKAVNLNSREFQYRYDFDNSKLSNGCNWLIFKNNCNFKAKKLIIER